MRREKSVTWSPPIEHETAIPSRAPNLAGDLLVPLGQATVTGLLAGTLLSLALVGLNFPAPAWHVWIGASLLATTCSWVVLLVEHRRLLWRVETLVGYDLNHDGVVGSPEKRRLEVELHAGRSTVFVGSDFLEMDDDHLLAFATGLSRGNGLAEGDWGKNRRAFPGGINDFRAFRARLLAAGLVRFVNADAPNLGYVLTPSGRAVFRRLAEHANKEVTHEKGV